MTARARSRRAGRRVLTLPRGSTTFRLRLGRKPPRRAVRVRLATAAGSAAVTIRLRR